jgi:hypothetical protein
MGALSAAPRRRSRFQVLTDGEVAWVDDGSGTHYRFDGFWFSRRRRRDAEYAVVPSWMTPAHGWVRVSECPCAPWTVSPDEAASRPELSSSHFAA